MPTPQSTFVIVHPDGSESRIKSAKARQMAEVFGTSPLYRANQTAQMDFELRDSCRSSLQDALSNPAICVEREDDGTFYVSLIGATVLSEGERVNLAMICDPDLHMVVAGQRVSAFDALVSAAEVDLSDLNSELPETFIPFTEADFSDDIDQWTARNWTSSERRMASRQSIWAEEKPGYICTSQEAQLESELDAA